MNLRNLFGNPAKQAVKSATKPLVATPSGPAPATTVAPVHAPDSGPTRHSALLLVEDDFLFRQLDEVFSHSARDWRFERAATVTCARQLLQQNKFSVMLSEATVQRQSTVDFLNEVHQQQPSVLRYFFGNTPAPADQKRLVGVRPSVIGMKTRREMVIAQLERELTVESWFSNTEIRRQISRFRNLPAIPTIYNQVIAELESPTGSFEEVAKLIAQDPLMTAKILQMVNSAIFALSSTVTRPEEAVLILGADRTKALVLAVHVFTRYDGSSCPGVSPDQIWQHSMDVAALARRVALSENCDSSVADEAFTAGLLHDIGKLLLAANLPTEYAAAIRLAKESGIRELVAERQKLGMTHADAAACLFGTWGLPLPVLKAIANHHQPSLSMETRFTPLTAVHVANALYYERRLSEEAVMDQDHIAQIGLLDHRNLWRTSCGVAPKAGEASLMEKIKMRQAGRVN